MQNCTDKHDKPTTTPDDGETPGAASGNNATTTSGPILPIADNVDGLVHWVELKRYAKPPKWKMTNDVHTTKARLTARGYKDTQAYDVNTYASF